MSVAELYRRLGPVPVAAKTTDTPDAPLLVGDLLRREGQPVPPASVDEPTALAIPVPRRRLADACRAATGAGGLVAAGSFLGAALLAAAGIGGPLFSGLPGGSEPAFPGEAVAGPGGRIAGTGAGQPVVSASGILRVAFDTILPPAPATTARPGPAVPRTQVAPGVRVVGAVPVATSPGPGAVPNGPGGAPVLPPADPDPSAPPTGSLPPVVEPVVEDVVTPVVEPVVEQVVTPVVEPVVEQVVTPVVEPVVEDVVTPVVEPVVEDVVTPVVEPVVEEVAPIGREVAEVVLPPVEETADALKESVPLPDAPTMELPAVSPLPATETDPTESIRDVDAPSGDVDVDVDVTGAGDEGDVGATVEIPAIVGR